MDPNELRRQKGELLAQAKLIQGELAAEDCDLNDTQRETREAKLDELLQQADAKEGEAKAEEARRAKSIERADLMDRLAQEGAAGGRAHRPDPMEGQRSDRIEVKEPAWTKDPMKGFDKPRDFFKAILSERHSDAAHAGDERLKYLAAAGSDEHGTFSDPYGGFLVPEGMSPDMLSVAFDDNPLAGRVTRIPMATPSFKIGARVDKDHSSSVSGGLTVSRRAETAAMTASRMKTEQITMEANSLYGLAYATEELLRDSPRSVAALLEVGFRDEFASQNTLDLLDGGGVGEPLGVANSPALIEVAKEGTQAADTIEGLNIVKMRERCWRYSQAVWVANHDTYDQLINVHVTGTNGDVYLFQPALGGGDIPDRLLGRPIVFSEYAETLGDKGDIYLLNMSQYLYGVYQPMESAESIHVRFDRNERAFKFWFRDAGQPWWRSALTPVKSTQTLSPFITLAARA